MTLNEKKAAYLAASSIGLLFFISVFLAYGASSKDPASIFFKKIYPAMFVVNFMVSIFDLERYATIVQSLDSQVTRRQAIDQMIFVQQAKNLARRLGVLPTAAEESSEKVFLTKNKQDKIPLSQRDLEQFVILPSAIRSRLAVWYYSDRSSAEAKNILSRIQSGEKFEDLAKTESDDKITGQFGGDMGFFERGDILPELESQIKAAPVGKVFDKLAVSRLGYHIIYLVETAEADGAAKWHAKHILIEGSGFDSWLAQQAGDIWVWQIMD